MATAGAEGTIPETKVKTFPDGGYYVMRTGWTMQDMMMVLQNRPDVDDQWHRQSDKQHVRTLGQGAQFLPRFGCRFLQRRLGVECDSGPYAATTAHNTLTLNGKNVTGIWMLKQETFDLLLFVRYSGAGEPSYED